MNVHPLTKVNDELTRMHNELQKMIQESKRLLIRTCYEIDKSKKMVVRRGSIAPDLAPKLKVGGRYARSASPTKQ
jgi:hypothetical protein